MTKPPTSTETTLSEQAPTEMSWKKTPATDTCMLAEFTVETEAFTLLAPSKTGYKCNGWFDNEGLAGDTITAIAGGATGDVTLYAS